MHTTLNEIVDLDGRVIKMYLLWSACTVLLICMIFRPVAILYNYLFNYPNTTHLFIHRHHITLLFRTSLDSIVSRCWAPTSKRSSRSVPISKYRIPLGGIRASSVFSGLWCSTRLTKLIACGSKLGQVIVRPVPRMPPRSKVHLPTYCLMWVFNRTSLHLMHRNLTIHWGQAQWSWWA